MQIFDDEKKRIGILKGYKNRAITTTLDSGDKELSFEYPANDEMTDLLKEECYIRTQTNEFVLKEIEKAENYNKYTAVLNVEELEGQVYPYGFESQEQTVKACLEFAFEGTGWIIGTCDLTKRRTISIDGNTTAWDVLQQCLSTYKCECKIDSLRKRIDIYDQIGRDRGCYFMEGLNLKKLTPKTDTYDFYTRIIPIGKDGITIEWLNGKPYLENYQYSKKVKTLVWKDERYTNTTSLMEDAAVKLEEISKPYKAYTAEVVDLAKMNPVYSEILDYDIGDVITIISKNKNTKEKQRIVKIVKYPEDKGKNTVEISNATKTFAEVQKTETELAKTEAISVANSNTKKVLANYSTTEEMETKITASAEKIELGVKNTLDGYYDKTETDSRIELGKGEIELSVSQTYQKKEDMKEYAKEEKLESEIKIALEQISMKVSKNEIVSEINQSADAVQISAEKINLNGAVTANGNVKIDKEGRISAVNANISGTIESTNANITGGTINIQTNSEKADIIKLSYNDYTLQMTPSSVIVKNGSNWSRITGNAVYGFNNSAAKWWMENETGNGVFGGDVNVNGTLYTASGTVSRSDESYKKDICDLDKKKSEGFIYGLKPCKYKYKDGTSDRYHHGFIAKQVKNEMPEDWGLYIEGDIVTGLRYEELIADMVAVIQNQNKRIEKLEKEIKTLGGGK